ncbi:MAG TPA: aminotransferase class V-fold PLP-dependent enzyme [Syntrophorhabdaceae bacterium]|nr:aminotransferase class V-fold PLP-dependent enzyme [Syntrophorhabdaceae bacterium]
MNKLIYLDNAATTFPKPASVMKKMIEIYSRIGVSPGRGSYDLAAEADELVAKTRRKVADFFGSPDPDRVIFTGNATDALNIALQGLLRPGDHAVSTRLEHNSVLRPLYHLHMKGIIEYDLVPFDGKGFVDPGDVIAAIRPNTKLVVVTHASNVLGTVQPVREIARLSAGYGIPLLVDAAQSAGVVPIDMQSWQIAGLAFTGHKSMLAPTGIGGLVLNREIEGIEPSRFGGTGVDSRSLVHTEAFPYRLEAGTLNLMSIIGLSESIEFLEQMGIESIHAKEMALLNKLRDGLSLLDGIELYCTENFPDHVGLLTANIRGMDPNDAGAILDGDFGIAVRVGLHCAPLVHESLGTSPYGSIRFSIGPFNTSDEIDHVLKAMAEIARYGNR